MKKELGYRIRKLRESRDFTQENMAAELGITGGAYAKIERGETDPSFTRLHDIADILGVSVASLIGGTGASPNETGEPAVGYGAVSRSEIDHLTQLIGRANREIEKIRTELAALKKRR
ncbi:helix-turn-helix domain-containing protein [Sediminibacterium soli]|uniref:helix-turn-helix domain-containing protein n=1 Tax=Sediminibacterium soli TaxID=2698829 RepID=UPI0013799DED|nr:helix-turn-helix domain-containing protein [Sediminibacterium soli]NCI45080.1 helix-turn-helix domain-containing protein [Sediminibacterium soli]